ncbi:MAG: hypothetical protein ACD_39C01631G0003, partial [uncultured bacterium]
MKDDSSQLQSATETIRIDDNDLARKKKDELIGLLSCCKGQKHLVIIQSYPDPDAISTGLAHKIISEQYEIEVDIIYAGLISHPENIALVKLLGIDLRKWDTNFDLKQYHATIFLDNQGTTVGPIIDAVQALKIPELIVVDHHE